MGRKWYQAEQIISKLREAEILGKSRVFASFKLTYMMKL